MADRTITLPIWISGVADAIVNFKGAALAQHLERKWLPIGVADSLETSMLSVVDQGKKRKGKTVHQGDFGSLELPSKPAQYGDALISKTEEVHNELSTAIQEKISAALRSSVGKRQLERFNCREDIPHLIDAAVCCLMCRTLLTIQCKYEAMYALNLKEVQEQPEKENKKAPKPPVSFMSHAFQLLLYAFDHFATQHMMNRTRFDLEDVGWDVPLLVQLVRFVTATIQCRSATDIEESGSGDTMERNMATSLGASSDLLGASTGGDDDDADGEAVNNINRSWRKLYIFCQDSDEGIPDRKSRRRGTIIVVNGLLTILLHVNNNTLCQRLVSSVEHTEKDKSSGGTVGGGSLLIGSGSLFAACSHIRAEIGKFHYYRGRFYFQSTNYQQAFGALREAWGYIASKNVDNIQQGKNDEEVQEVVISSQHQRSNEARILFYWCSTSIALGLQIPIEFQQLHPELVSTFFLPIQEGIQQGDVHKFVSAIDNHRALFRQYGVYFALLGARKFVYLALLRRVCLELQFASKSQEIDASRIPLGIVVAAVEHKINSRSEDEKSGNNFDLELQMFKEDVQPSKRRRVETVDTHGTPPATGTDPETVPQVNTKILDIITLWIARLISEGYVKGYISYEHLILVLSRKEPFPVVVKV